MSKHTPGPWALRASGFAFHIYGVFKKSKNAFITIAYWSDPDYGASRTEAEANANLVLAAPDMFKALTRLSAAALARDSAMGDPIRVMEVRAELFEAVKAAQPAIDKALGIKAEGGAV